MVNHGSHSFLSSASCPLYTKYNVDLTAFCLITVSYRLAALHKTRGCEGGSDDSNATPRISHAYFERNCPCGGHQSRQDSSGSARAKQDRETSSLLRVWNVPRVLLELFSGRIAFSNVSSLLTNADLAYKDLLFGHSILRHCVIDSWNASPRRRFMILRLRGVSGSFSIPRRTLSSQRPRGRYFTQNNDPNPFLDPSSIDLAAVSDYSTARDDTAA